MGVSLAGCQLQNTGQALLFSPGFLLGRGRLRPLKLRREDFGTVDYDEEWHTRNLLAVQQDVYPEQATFDDRDYLPQPDIDAALGRLRELKDLVINRLLLAGRGLRYKSNSVPSWGIAALETHKA